MTLRSKLIRLAHDNPELRPQLLPLLKEAAQAFNKPNVTKWMRNHASEFDTATELAEDAADEFGAKDKGGPLDDDTHWIWDLAQDAMSWSKDHA